MKALILAGGKGTRLRPITHTSAKQLIPVANKPILFYGIEAIRAAGITEVGFIVGDTRNEIREAIGNGSQWDIRPTFIEQEAPLGLAHAVKIARDFIDGDDFLMFLGDNLLREGVRSIVEDFNHTKPNAHILLAHVKNPQDFGVAEIKGKRVVRLVEKPTKPKSNYALVGVYIFDKKIFDAVNAIKPSARGELEITDAIQYLIEKKHTVHHKIVDGWWKDTGKLEDIIEANRLIIDMLTEHCAGTVDAASHIEGKVAIDAGAIIKDSTIRGPAVIGSGCHILNSYVGPFTAIDRDVTIENSEIENSIVLEHALIRDVKRIETSLIGKNVTVAKTKKKPSAYRLMVGDTSHVEIA